jgi:hypothetical protein
MECPLTLLGEDLGVIADGGRPKKSAAVPCGSSAGCSLFVLLAGSRNAKQPPGRPAPAMATATTASSNNQFEMGRSGSSASRARLCRSKIT